MLPDIVACSSQGQQEKEPEEAAFLAIFIAAGGVGGYGGFLFQGSSHAVPIGAIRP
jgi:hypothetical protein